MKPTFDHTVGILVKAYLNGTLVHGNCYACAVGNLVAEGMRYKFVKCKDEPYRKIVWDLTEGNYDTHLPMWYTYLGCGLRSVPEEVRYQIKSTGYSFENLRRIEYAFERCDQGKSEEQYMFNGLMNVVDVFADIHGIDLTSKDQAKKLFVKV